MVDGVGIYFNIGGFTYQQNFEEGSMALHFVNDLEDCGLEDGGTVEDKTVIGCRETKRYGINVWEGFSQRRISKKELEELLGK